MINDACRTLCDKIHKYMLPCCGTYQIVWFFKRQVLFHRLPSVSPRPSWQRLVIQTKRRFGAVLMPLQQYQRPKPRGNRLEFWGVRHWKTVLQLNSNIHLKKAVFLVGLLVDEIWCVSKVWENVPCSWGRRYDPTPEDFFFEKWCLEKT